MSPTDLSWQENGNCRNHPTDLFYPEMATRDGQLKARHAVSICRTCDVVSQCRSYAIENESFGIWGGMTEGERLKHRRTNSIAVRFPNPLHRGDRFNGTTSNS
jgi:WhiB family redox-sensing transcriptional regulator